MYLLNKRQVAEMLACSVRQVDFLRAEKNLPWVAVGALVRFDRSEVEAWMEGQRKTGGPAEQRKQDTKDNEGKEVC